MTVGSTRWWCCALVGLAAVVAACGGGGNAEEGMTDAAADRAGFVAALEDSTGLEVLDRSAARCLAGGIVDAVGTDVIIDAGLGPDEFAELESLRAGGIRATRAQRDALAEAFGECLPIEFVFQAVGEITGVEISEEAIECLADEVDTRVFAAWMSEQYVGVGSTSVEEVLLPFQTGSITCKRQLRPDLGAPGDLSLRDGRDAFVEALADALATPVQEDAPIAFDEDEASCVAASVINVLGPQLVEKRTTVAAVLDYIELGVDPVDVGLDVSRGDAERLAREYFRCVDLSAQLRRTLTTFFGAVVDDAVFDCIIDEIDRDAWLVSVADQFEHGLPTDPTEMAEANRPFTEAGERCSQQ
jgi:hypothetical protein